MAKNFKIGDTVIVSEDYSPPSNIATIAMLFKEHATVMFPNGERATYFQGDLAPKVAPRKFRVGDVVVVSGRYSGPVGLRGLDGTVEGIDANDDDWVKVTFDAGPGGGPGGTGTFNAKDLDLVSETIFPHTQTPTKWFVFVDYQYDGGEVYTFTVEQEARDKYDQYNDQPGTGATLIEGWERQ